jgi:hypothetical protein
MYSKGCAFRALFVRLAESQSFIGSGTVSVRTARSWHPCGLAT